MSRTAAPPAHIARGPRARRPLENIDIARMREEIADLLEIQDKNAFRIRACRAAARAAHEAGVHLVISTDAHRIEELACMRYGVDQARRAWCERRHVLNSLPLGKLRSVLQP